MDKELQVSNATHYNRYPEIFSAIKEISTHNMSHDKLEILSFGCSTGEEVKALKELYFFNDNITGTDLNEYNIQVAKDNVKFDSVNFINSKEFNYSDKKYDIVFCMSVLCKVLYSNLSEEPLDFNLFEEALSVINSKIKVGGYLVVYNCNYHILQSSVSDCFKPISHPNITKSFNEALMFNKEKELVKEDDAICIFKKIK